MTNKLTLVKKNAKKNTIKKLNLNQQALVHL